MRLPALHPPNSVTGCPYIFPPVPAIPAVPGSNGLQGALPLPFSRGPLRCRTLAPGPAGSAAYVRPARGGGGLVSLDVHAGEAQARVEQGWAVRERLVGLVIPGTGLAGGSAGEEVCERVLLENAGVPWSCMDYDEGEGLLAVGSGEGVVQVLTL
jgi:hypothetical protein